MVPTSALSSSSRASSAICMALWAASGEERAISSASVAMVCNPELRSTAMAASRARCGGILPPHRAKRHAKIARVST
jgi:hypothetical protein